MHSLLCAIPKVEAWLRVRSRVQVQAPAWERELVWAPVQERELVWAPAWERVQVRAPAWAPVQGGDYPREDHCKSPS